jgi:hypothetical protein
MAARTFDPQPVYVNIVQDAFEWAVDHYIPEDGITCFLGEPGAGKTYAAVDVACCKATGLDCWGRQVGRPRKVIYIAADAGRGIKARIIAWVVAHREALKAAGIEMVRDADGNETLPNLLVWPKPVSLHGSLAVAAATRDIKELGLSCDVLCVDTLFHSAGKANLAKPEDLLPVLEELEKLMEALQAKTCILVHHTTKDGETYFGTVVFEATLSAMILFKKKTEDKLTKTVHCMRIREGEAFDDFEIKMQKVTMRTKPDQFGRTEQTMLSVIPGTAPAAQRPTKEDEDLEAMEMVLAVHLHNKATYTQWFERMVEVTRPKKDKKTGEMRPGLSETTFRRRLAVIVQRGHTTLPTTGQGGTYSILAGYWAAGLQPGSVVSTTTATAVTNNRQLHPLLGGGEVGGGFGDRQVPPNHRQNENGGGSSEGRAEGKNTPAVPGPKPSESELELVKADALLKKLGP